LLSTERFTNCKCVWSKTRVLRGVINKKEMQQSQEQELLTSSQFSAELVLPILRDGLLEEPVLVPQPIAPAREVQGCDGVQEARSQAAETSVAQSSIGLLHSRIDAPGLRDARAASRGTRHAGGNAGSMIPTVQPIMPGST